MKRSSTQRIDLPRVKAALARLDELAKKHPRLKSTDSRERLADAVEAENANKNGTNDGREKN